MQNLTIFKSPFVESLRCDIPRNLAKYLADPAWVTSIGTRFERDLPTPLAFRRDLDMLRAEEGDHKDIENAVHLHQALPELTRMNARDPRLWTRLTHVELWPYMRQRWPIQKYMKDGEKVAIGRVLERYFVPQSQSRALMRNGAARLWWGAHLTFDPKSANSYELTSVLFSTLDIAQQILERGLGRAPVVLTAFLEFMLKHKAELLTGGDANRARIRALAKFLNMHGGVCILDCLSKAEIMDLLERQYELLNKAQAEANAKPTAQATPTAA